MAPSFFRKLGLRTKSKRRAFDLRRIWIRPNLEALDQRILPSVTATLQGGILSVVADTSSGTTEVKLVHDQDQVDVKDGDQLVNNFGIDQIQRIDFQYNTANQQQYNLSLPIGQNQITLTNLPVGEADLTLGDSSLTAAINANLPDGTALNLAGTVDGQGNYDVTGTADVTVAGFSLQGAMFEVTNSSVAVSATATVGADSVSLAGALDQGHYDLRGSADLTIDGFSLPATSFELTDGSLAAAATLALDNNTINLSGTVDSQGHYDLAASVDSITIGGFALSNASLELTDTTLTAGATVTLGDTSVALNGSLDSSGNYDLTGTADVSIAGFSLPSTSFELTNAPANGIKVATSLPLGDTTVNLAGTVDADANFDLTASIPSITIGGFTLSNASVELTNTSLTVGAHLSVADLVEVDLSGTYGADGSYSLTGTLDSLTVAGFSLSGLSFTLANGPDAQTITWGGRLAIPSVTDVDVTGTLGTDGTYALAGDTADPITLGGFSLTTAHFGLANTTGTTVLTVGAHLSIPGLLEVDLSGSYGADGSYSLTGTLDSLTVGGFTLTGLSFTLGNGPDAQTITVGGHLSLPIVDADLSGTFGTDGSVSLTASTVSLNLAGFVLSTDSITLARDGSSGTVSLTVSNAHFSIPNIVDVTLSGSVGSDGSYSVSGTAQVTLGGFVLPAVTLTFADDGQPTASQMVHAPLDIPGIGHVDLTGTILKDDQGHYSLGDLTGMAHITVAGIDLNATFTLGSSSLTVAADLTIGTLATVHLTGTVTDDQGTYTLSAMSGQAHITFAGYGLDATFTLTSTSLTAAADLAIGTLATVHLTGTITNNQLTSMSGQAHITFAGIGLDATFTLTPTSLTAAADLAIGTLATVHLTGTVTNNQLTSMSGQAHITFAGVGLDATFTLTPASLTAAADLAIGTLATVHLTGTVSNNQLTSMSGQAHITFAGLGLDATFTLTPASLTAAADLTLGTLATVHLTGTITNNQLTSMSGQAHITFAGYGLDATFTVTPASVTAAADLTIGTLATVHLMGTVMNNQLTSMSGQAHITFAGFQLNATFTLTPASLTAAADLALGTLATVHFTGTITNNQLTSMSGQAQITFAGVGLNATFTLTPASLTAAADLALGTLATVHLTGTVTNNQLTSMSGQAHITFAGFGLDATFNVTSAAITATAGVAITGVGNVNLTGTVSKNGSNYTLTSMSGSAHVTIAGFSLDPTFTLTSTSLTVTVDVAIPSVATVHFSGTVDSHGNFSLTGTAHATIAGFSLDPTFTLTNTSLTVTVDVAIPGVATVHFSGTVDNHGQFSLTGSVPFSIAGFNVTPTFTLTNTSLTVAVGINIPGVGPLNFSGTVDGHGNFSLSAMTHIVIAGFGLDATFRLTNTSLTVAATVNLPVVGNVNLSGTVDSHGNYSLTAGVSDIHILFVTLTNASVTLTNTSLTVAAKATGLPLIGTVDFTGTITGSSYTFTATLPSVSVLGATLKNLHVTLTNSALSVGAHMDSIPLVGSADFNGNITSSGFSLSASVTNVTIIGFHFSSISLTLTQQSLSLSTTTSLPIVGSVTFAGTISFSGAFTISATAPHFTLLGFIGVDNASVAISFPNPKLTVSAHINLLNIGMVDFTGSIGAGGTFSFDGSASLTVAGFTLGTARMHMGNMPGDPSDGIHIGPFTTPALPLVGPVTIEGSYAAGGRFSFLASIHPTPPIMIGPIPVDQITFGLSNDSLTLGIGVGYDLGGFLHIGGYGQVTVFAQSSQHNWGDFDLLARVDVSLVAFQAAGGQMELKNTKGQFSFTMDAQLNLIIATAQFHGEIDFNKGLVGFEGSANIGVAGFTLSNSNFLITNAQVQNNNGVWTFPHDAQGHLIPGGGIHIEVHSHTNLNLQPVISANVDFDCVFQKQGSGYYIDVKGKANLTIAGFNIAQATLEIDNSHMSATFHYAYPGIFSADFAGTITFNGNFDFTATATVGLAGFGATANLHLYKMGSNAGLDISTHINVIIAQVDFSGYLHSDGQFQLTGRANVGLAGFNVVTVSFTLNNHGVSLAASVNVYVATVAFSGSVDTHGNFSLTGSANVGLAGFSVANAAFTLTNSGCSFHVNVNVFVATVAFSGSVDTHGNFRLTGTANVGLAGFSVASASFTLTNSGVSFDTSVNVYVATVHFSGSVDTHGNFRLTGSANVGLAGFNVASASFTLSNSGVSFSTTVNVYVATVSFSGSVDNHGNFRLTGSAGVRLAGFSLATASFTLTNSGVSFDFTLNVYVATVHFSGSVDTHGNFRLTGSASVGFAGFGGSGTFTLTNSGLTFSGSINVIVATINVTGSVSSSGAFSFTVNIHMGFAGFGASGSLTLNNSGVRVSATLDLSVLGIRMGFSGAVNANGTFSFTLHAGLNWGIISASADFTLSNHGFSVQLHAGFDLSAGVSAGFWSLRIGFRGSVDVGFGINTNGTFNANGSISACAYVGIGICVGIGFYVNNHQFCIKTGDIGFSIWGIGFHPFGDLCVGY